MIASNVDAMTDGSDEADEERAQDPAADGDDVLADGDRPVASTVDGGQTLTSLGAPECAEHSADDSAAERAEGMEERAADDRTGKRSHDDPRHELWRRLAARRLRELVGDQFHHEENRQNGDGDRMGDPLRPLPIDVDPAQKRAPCHHRRSGQRTQTGDHTDQQTEQDNEDLGHENLPTGENDIRTLTRTGGMIRPNQKRQNRRSEARIALAPIDASSSMIALTSRRGTRARTATHAGSASGAIVGDSSPGVTAAASSRTLRGQS